MDNKEAVRLLSQALCNLPENYPYKAETSRAFGFLGIRKLADTSYSEIVVAPENNSGFVTTKYEDLPFKRFNPEVVTSPSLHIGEIKTDYKTLCRIFGRHDKYYDAYKQDAAWHVEFQNGEKVTISNYKDGHNYLGREGNNLVDIKRWDVWGTEAGFNLLKKTIKSK